MGFCIGNPLIWNLQKRAPGRIVASVHAQPSGADPNLPDFFIGNNLKSWAPGLIASKPEFTMDMVNRYLDKMYKGVDFVLTASRDFVRNCQTPLHLDRDAQVREAANFQHRRVNHLALEVLAALVSVVHGSGMQAH